MWHLTYIRMCFFLKLYSQSWTQIECLCILGSNFCPRLEGLLGFEITSNIHSGVAADLPFYQNHSCQEDLVHQKMTQYFRLYDILIHS